MLSGVYDSDISTTNCVVWVAIIVLKKHYKNIKLLKIGSKKIMLRNMSSDRFRLSI